MLGVPTSEGYNECRTEQRRCTSVMYRTEKRRCTSVMVLSNTSFRFSSEVMNSWRISNRMSICNLPGPTNRKPRQLWV